MNERESSNQRRGAKSRGRSFASILGTSLILSVGSVALYGAFGLDLMMMMKPALENERQLEVAISGGSDKETAILSMPNLLYPNKPQLCEQDSLGLITGISDDQWKRRRELTRHYAHRKIANRDPSRVIGHSIDPKQYYQENWEPDFSCLNEQPLGNQGDGHKWVCDPHRIQEQAARSHKAGTQETDGCIVYSIGSNGKFDFELDVHKNMPSCEIHTFDFTDYSHRVPEELKQESNRTMNYHAWGLKPHNASDADPDVNPKPTPMFKPKFATKLWETKPDQSFKSLQDTMKELGHTNRRIDIFKIDCEGCEFFSYRDWVGTGPGTPDIRQILVEVHETPTNIDTFFESIHNAGFVMFHKEPNIQWASGACVEFAFLKMAPSFFSD